MWLRSGILILASAALLRADAGHEVKVEELTAAIAAQPDVRDLYYTRATHYRELGQVKEMRADLEKCLSLEPGYLPAIRELARMEELAGQNEAAVRRMEEAIRQAVAAPTEASGFHLPGCYTLLGQLLLKIGRNEDALRAVEQGLSLSPELSIDLVLLKSEVQRRLGRKEARVQELEQVMGKVKAYLIRLAWIEALIDAGDAARALPEIEREIASSRLVSSWLIRRARVYHFQGRKAEAAADLAAATEEIQRRLRPESPDPTLLCDMATIAALSGDAPGCARKLEEARARKADECFLRVPEALLAAMPVVK